MLNIIRIQNSFFWIQFSLNHKMDWMQGRKTFLLPSYKHSCTGTKYALTSSYLFTSILLFEYLSKKIRYIDKTDRKTEKVNKIDSTVMLTTILCSGSRTFCSGSGSAFKKYTRFTGDTCDMSHVVSFFLKNLRTRTTSYLIEHFIWAVYLWYYQDCVNF